MTTLSEQECKNMGDDKLSTVIEFIKYTIEELNQNLNIALKEQKNRGETIGTNRSFVNRSHGIMKGAGNVPGTMKNEDEYSEEGDNYRKNFDKLFTRQSDGSFQFNERMIEQLGYDIIHLIDYINRLTKFESVTRQDHDRAFTAIFQKYRSIFTTIFTRQQDGSFIINLAALTPLGYHLNKLINHLNEWKNLDIINNNEYTQTMNIARQRYRYGFDRIFYSGGNNVMIYSPQVAATYHMGNHADLNTYIEHLKTLNIITDAEYQKAKELMR
jgi:hypothetical protein